MERLYIISICLVIIILFIFSKNIKENMATLSGDSLILFNNINSIPGLVGYFIPENIGNQSWTNQVTSTNKVSDGILTSKTGLLTTPPADPSINNKSYITGTKDTIINWENFPNDYTFFHITKYNGTTKGRIFNGAGGVSWFSGFWGGVAGVAHQNVWNPPGTPNAVFYYASNNYNNNWFLSTDQLQLYRTNGTQAAMTVTTNANSPNGKITINGGGEVSDFASAIMVIFNRKLSGSEIESVERYLNNYYNLQIYPTTTPAITTPAITTPAITTPIETVPTTYESDVPAETPESEPKPEPTPTFTITPTPTSKTTNSNTLYIVIIGAIVAVLVIGVVVYFINKKSKKKSNSGESKGSESDDGDDGESGTDVDNNKYWYF